MVSTGDLFPPFELHEVLDGLLKLPPHKAAPPKEGHEQCLGSLCQGARTLASAHYVQQRSGGMRG